VIIVIGERTNLKFEFCIDYQGGRGDDLPKRRVCFPKPFGSIPPRSWEALDHPKRQQPVQFLSDIGSGNLQIISEHRCEDIFLPGPQKIHGNPQAEPSSKEQRTYVFHAYGYHAESIDQKLVFRCLNFKFQVCIVGPEIQRLRLEFQNFPVKYCDYKSKLGFFAPKVCYLCQPPIACCLVQQALLKAGRVVI
jgi:hypothetical protein